MIDLHIHILPGIDDGSSSLEESLMMADMAVRSGVHTVVATPHCNLPGLYRNYFDSYFYDKLQYFRLALERERIPLTVYSGMEIYCSEDIRWKIEDGKVISLNHSRYYLTEFHFHIENDEMMERASSLLAAGCIPVLAHPERYACIQYQPEILYHLMKAGCLSQVNKGSLLGRFGEIVKKTADELMNRGLVTCVASDAHGIDARTPFMGEIQDYLEMDYGYDTARMLLYENPLRIIQNKRVPFSGK